MWIGRALVVVGVTVGALGCGAGAPVPDVASVRDALDRMHVEHSAAYLREDLDAVMDLYTADPVIRSNHVEPLRGREAIRAFIGDFFSAVDVEDLRYGVDELAVHGDSAYAIGTFEATVRTPAGERMTDRGSYMVLYLRDATGAWRSHRGVFNSSVPLPTS